MEIIQDRINKLLALAQSPNENEAKLAMLRARELMAKYKLTTRDLAQTKSAKVQRVTVPECIYTALTDNWVMGLASVIAKHYCCVDVCTRRPNHKSRTPAFYGLEEDVQLCVKIFRYAYDSIKAGTRRRIYRCPYESASTYRERCNAYGQGFVQGLKEALDAQNQSSEELALALATPTAVQEEVDRICGKKATPFRYRSSIGQHLDAAAAGYQEGKNFQPNHRIQGESEQEASSFLPEAAL